MNGTPAVLHAPPAPPAPAKRTVVRPGVRRAARTLLSFGLVVGLLAFVLPRIVGTTLSDVVTALKLVTAPDAAVLVVLWLAGLAVYSTVLTGALHGLRQRQALTLNLTGSAVANVLPFGGAAGMSLNFLMMRTWGFSAQEFSAFTLVTNLWGILLKLALPAIALGALVASGGSINHVIRWTALGAVIALVLVVGALIGFLARRGLAVRLVAMSAPLVVRGCRLVRRPTTTDVVSAQLMEFRDRVVTVIERRWGQLSVGMIGYGVLQAVLLWACLRAVGAPLGVTVVLAAYAVDRMMSMIVITPGGTGFAEAGAAGALVALGGAPAAMAAGVLLYRGFTFALEIPVGGAWLGGWLWARKRRAKAAA